VSDYDRVERALRFLDSDFRSQPDLARVAAATGLSEAHFQRLFRRWAGVSPKRFLQFVTAEYARDRLLSSRSVLDASLDAGLSGPGRLHDLTVSVHAMTPGEIGRGGAGLVIRHGVHATPFGRCFVAATERGVTAMSFLDGALDELRSRWPAARFARDARTRTIIDGIFEGRPVERVLHVPGTNFQVRVWQALLEIPPGEVRSYGDIARALGTPRSARAVGGAVAANPVAYLIPCHRVIRGSGAWGDYRWGPTRKRALLGWEAAVTS
jgi:AraC family transcriptional regulator of adaptative response/methylated-DNA-[protein]-cysteine methyltransferase